MAATVTFVKTNALGNRDQVTFTVTGDSSYPTGGYAITVPVLTITDYVLPTQSNASHYGIYDSTTGKLRFYVNTTGAEVANATNVSTSTLTVLANGN